MRGQRRLALRGCGSIRRPKRRSSYSDELACRKASASKILRSTRRYRSRSV